MRRTTELQGKKNSIVQQEMGGIVRIGMGIMAQDAVFNPSPLPDLQVGPGLKFRLAMDMAKAMTGEDAPLIDSRRPFF